MGFARAQPILRASLRADICSAVTTRHRIGAARGSVQRVVQYPRALVFCCESPAILDRPIKSGDDGLARSATLAQ
jgi:hypothetical protein